MAYARRLAPAFAFSTGVHAILFLFLIWGIWRTAAATRDALPQFDVVYFNQTGPSGGSGGGTAGQAPLRKLLMPKAMPAPPAPVVAAPLTPPPPTEIPPITNFADVMQSAGVAGVALADRGTGGLGREGVGLKTGPGIGDGLPGKGDGPYGLGDDIQGLALIRKVPPKYTAEAMRAKKTGDVWLDAIVQKNGTVRVIGVRKSLDTVFGLDQAAIDAAKEWVFSPGKKNGLPVEVLVTLVLEFRLH